MQVKPLDFIVLETVVLWVLIIYLIITENIMTSLVTNIFVVFAFIFWALMLYDAIKKPIKDKTKNILTIFIFFFLGAIAYYGSIGRKTLAELRQSGKLTDGNQQTETNIQQNSSNALMILFVVGMSVLFLLTLVLTLVGGLILQNTSVMETDLAHIVSKQDLASLGFDYSPDSTKVNTSVFGTRSIYSFDDSAQTIPNFYGLIIYLPSDNNIYSDETNRNSSILGSQGVLNSLLNSNMEKGATREEVVSGIPEDLNMYHLISSDKTYEGYIISAITTNNVGLTLYVKYPTGKYSYEQIINLNKLIIQKN